MDKPKHRHPDDNGQEEGGDLDASGRQQLSEGAQPGKSGEDVFFESLKRKML